MILSELDSFPLEMKIFRGFLFFNGIYGGEDCEGKLCQGVMPGCEGKLCWGVMKSLMMLAVESFLDKYLLKI